MKSKTKKKKDRKFEKNSFLSYYSDCWKYLVSCKLQICLIVSLFFLFSLMGFFFSTPEGILDIILKYIENLLEETRDMSTFQLISFIFLNNFQVSLMGIIFGLFLGILPILFAAFNGYVLGIVAYLVSSQEGFFSLLSLLPHGVFELPAIFISLGIGLKLGFFLFQKDKKTFLRENVLGALKVFVFVIFPLLILAAIIEGFFISLF